MRGIVDKDKLGRFAIDVDMRSRVRKLYDIHVEGMCDHERSCVWEIASEVERAPHTIYEMLTRMGLPTPKKPPKKHRQKG